MLNRNRFEVPWDSELGPGLEDTSIVNCTVRPQARRKVVVDLDMKIIIIVIRFRVASSFISLWCPIAMTLFVSGTGTHCIHHRDSLAFLT